MLKGNRTEAQATGKTAEVIEQVLLEQDTVDATGSAVSVAKDGHLSVSRTFELSCHCTPKCLVKHQTDCGT